MVSFSCNRYNLILVGFEFIFTLTALLCWKYQFPIDHWSQATLSLVSTWMGDLKGNIHRCCYRVWPDTPWMKIQECQATLYNSTGSVSIYYITLACTGRFKLFAPVKDPSTPGFSSKECQATLYNSTCVYSPSGLPFRY